jgi:large subunit ribosomal protein L21
MFAVIKTGGRQYRVVPNDVLEIGKIAGDVGTIVQLGEVLVLGGDTPVLGLPTVAGASVAAEVLQHKRRRKNSRRKRGYRDEITVLRITEILADNAKPSIGPRPKKEKVAPAPAEDDDEAPKTVNKAAKKAAPKKAATKPAASKVATNKAAAKPRAKAETKKPAAKKTAAKGKSDKK